MITAETKAYKLRKGSWIKVNPHEVSTVQSIASKPKGFIVYLTNGLSFYLRKLDVMEEVLMM